MRIVVVSATSLIAQHCIRLWAKTGEHEFILVGRSREKLKSTKSDLGLRFPSSVFSIALVDFTSSQSIETFVEGVAAKPIDIVLVAQGALTEQPKASKNLSYLKQQLELNAVSVAVVVEAFASVLEKQGGGTLGVIGSVAGDRGRAYNYSYGASKSLIETYTQGLQQRFAGSKVSVSLIKPGPTATPMTSGHAGKMATPESVAGVIVSGLRSGRLVIYAPRFWEQIMFVVRCIPFWVFKHLKF